MIVFLAIIVIVLVLGLIFYLSGKYDQIKNKINTKRDSDNKNENYYHYENNNCHEKILLLRKNQIMK